MKQRIWQLGLGSLTGWLLLGAIASAQLVPDTTLGTEGSTVQPNVMIRGQLGDRINGGAARSGNLFHSFSQFNVLNGQRVYFSNPAGIQNILTRVTGADISRIFGTLGVDGAANLFLMNPNGIFFGPNARLDIAGSFVGTTANRFTFPDGSAFSAVNPQGAPLLSVTLRPGLQYGGTPGPIVNQGNLRVGGDLGLAGGNLTLQGQLHAGGDLTLYATDTLQIRDQPEQPFVAQAGGALLAQGDRAVDIFALNHPQSGLFSGGDLTLRSGGDIIGDAHFYGGGNFRIEQLDGQVGSWFSPNDPVVRAAGDVTFGNYVGFSLHVLAGGSVTAGNITINGADAANGLTEDVPLSNGQIVPIRGAAEPTLDIRAGTTAFGVPGITGAVPGAATTAIPTSANITVGNILINPFAGAGGGQVFLSNQYQPRPDIGNITVNSVSGYDFGAPRAVNVVIDGRGDITLNQGNTLLGPAAIVSGGLLTGGSGGDITLLAQGNITSSGGIGSFGTQTGNSGTILVQSGGTVSLDNSQVISLVFGSGQGGPVTVGAERLILDNAAGVLTQTRGAGGAGNVTVNANTVILRNSAATTPASQIGSLAAPGSTGNAGNLTIIGRSLSVTGGTQLVTTTFGAGKAGNLNITMTEQAVFDGVIPDGAGNFVFAGAFSNSEQGATGASGTLTLNTGNLRLTNGAQLRTSTRGPSNAGNLNVRADTITLTGVGRNGEGSSITSLTRDGSTTARGGNIDIRSRVLTVTDGGVISSNTSSSDPRGIAGNITVVALESATFDGVGANDEISGIRAATFGPGAGGLIRVTTGNLAVTNGAQIQSNANASGNAGNVEVTTTGNMLVAGAGSGLFASTIAAGQGGTIQVGANTLSLLNGGQFRTSTTGAGNAGSITANAAVGLQVAGANSGLFANTTGAGQGGTIAIGGPHVSFLDGGQLLTSSTGSGNAGSITANVGRMLLTGANTGFFANTTSTGQGGAISVVSSNLALTNGAQVLTSTSGAGNAGNMSIFAAQDLLLSDPNTGLFANTTAGSTGAGGQIGITVTGENTFTIQNGARVSVDSQGSGIGGDITAQAIRLVMNDQAVISAETASNTGGNINLQVRDLLLLRRASRISTTAGTAQGAGNGGNIRIGTTFLVAVREENSDITANAFLGSGGRVDITAQGIYGIEFRTRLTPFSDITASSQFGVDGIVVIDTPDLDPSRGLSELPVTPVDASQLVAQTCPGQGGTATQQSEFVVTGRGGLPAGPSDALRSPVIWDDLRSRTIPSTPAPQATVPEHNATTPIVEAQTWVRDASGRLMLVAQAPSSQSGFNPTPATTCRPAPVPASQ